MKVDLDTRPDGARPDRCLIPDLRGTGLGQLAMQAAAGEKEVSDVVSRIVESRESPSGTPAMMFQSAI